MRVADRSPPAATDPRIGAGTVHSTPGAVYGCKSQVGAVGRSFSSSHRSLKMLSRILQSLLVAGLLTGTSWAANDPFVGQWKLNPSRSTLTDEMKVTKV